MLNTYTIDEQQIKTAANKMLFKMIRMYAVILVIVIIPNIQRNSIDPVKILFPLFFMIPILALALYLGYRRYTKTLIGLKIIIDETGIEIKAPMAPYKKIDWTQMGYNEKKNGVVKVYDTSVSAASRWWTGTGVILIPFEISDREGLINQINVHLIPHNV